MVKIRFLIWEFSFVRILLFSFLSVFFTETSALATTTSCTAATSGINFGSYLGLTLSINGTLSITCQYIGSADPIYILLGPATFNPRVMLSSAGGGPGSLRYNIYTNSAYNVIWAFGTGGGAAVGPLACIGSSPCTVANQTMYGQVPALQITLYSNFLQIVPFIIATNSTGSNVVGSGMFNVTARNSDNCRISANDAYLGTYVATSSLQGSGSIAVTCTAATTPSVTLQPVNAGATATGSGVMINGSYSLNYQLYTPVSNMPNASCAYTTEWGVTNPFVINVNNANTPLIYNICINVPAGQNVPAGTYIDNVIAIITF
jgi:spore coat protein U-like protein